MLEKDVSVSFWVWHIPHGQNKLITQNYIRWIKSSHANIVLIAILITTFKNIIKTTLVSVLETSTVYLRSISSQINLQLYVWFKIQNKCSLWLCPVPGKILRVLKNNEQNSAEKDVACFDQAAASSLVTQKQMLSAWACCPEEVSSSPTELSSLFTQTAGTHAQRRNACWVSILIIKHRLALNWLACCTLIYYSRNSHDLIICNNNTYTP